MGGGMGLVRTTHQRPIPFADIAGTRWQTASSTCDDDGGYHDGYGRDGEKGRSGAMQCDTVDR